MTEKAKRASRASIGARLKDTDKVADFGMRQHGAACQNVQRCAQRPNDAYGVLGRRIQFIHQGDWIIPLDGLPEIPRSRKAVMHSPAADQELLAARNFAVIHSSQ